MTGHDLPLHIRSPTVEGRVSREMCRNAAKLVQIARKRIRQNSRGGHVNDISASGFLASGKPLGWPSHVLDVERYRGEVSRSSRVPLRIYRRQIRACWCTLTDLSSLWRSTCWLSTCIRSTSTATSRESTPVEIYDRRKAIARGPIKIVIEKYVCSTRVANELPVLLQGKSG